MESSNTSSNADNVVSQLPNELLAIIFSAGTKSWRDPHELPFPVLISGVCRHWRLVAHDTPILWTFIAVPLHTPENICIHWTTEWIERSGALPISVVIDDPKTDLDTEKLNQLVSIILDLVVEYSQRLRRLDIRVKSNNYTSIRDATARLWNAPNLQQLSLCFYDLAMCSVETKYPHWTWLSTLPMLTKFKAEGMRIPITPNLTSLSIHRLLANYEEISSMFASSPNLRYLALSELLPMTSPVPAQAPVIYASSLESLAVNMRLRSSHPNPIYLFQYLAIPNVVYLELDGDAWTPATFGNSLSSAKIDTLRVSNRPHHSRGSDLNIRFLHSFTTVRYLQLIHAPTQPFLSNLDENVQGIPRRRSIDANRPIRPTTFHNIHSIDSQQSMIPWPNLRIISLETLISQDVANLCEFVARHKLLEIGDTVYSRPTFFSSKLDNPEGGLAGVEEWLGTLVQIRTAKSLGLLQTNQEYLDEMV
ncbi:hypothetical protein B0H34DRAFT_396394 [Crassisporium funariophilum]|nr:hypothetical protein B0H34DRAFT_396394 [Crassisporium funariophilum]